MGKKLRFIPDDQEEVATETTPQKKTVAFTPDEDTEPVKKKESTTVSQSSVPSGDGSQTPSTPSSENGAAADARAYLDELNRTNDPDSYREKNPFVTFGKKAWQAIAYDLPSSLAATATLTAGTDPFKLPQTPEAKKKEQEATHAVKVDLLEWAGKRQEKGAKMTKLLVSQMEDIKDPIDVLNYVSGATGNAVGQIPVTVATGGTSAIGQEVGSVYLEGVQRISRERGISVDEVLNQNLDAPAAAIAYGVVAGFLDKIGAGKVLGNFTKEAVKKSIKDRTKSVIASGLTEGLTEYGQTYMEQLGSSQVAGKSFTEAFAEAHTSEKARERLEAFTQGAIGGGVLSGASTLISPDRAVTLATSDVDVSNEAQVDASAQEVQANVDANEQQIIKGDTETNPIVNEKTQAQPDQPVGEQAAELVVSKDETKEEAPAPSEAHVEVGGTVDESQPKTLYIGDDADINQAPQATDDSSGTQPASTGDIGTQSSVEAAPNVQQEEGSPSAEQPASQESPQAQDQNLERSKSVNAAIDELVASGDLRRDANNKVTVLTEKGGQELKRIFEENQVNTKRGQQNILQAKQSEDAAINRKAATNDSTEDQQGGAPLLDEGSQSVTGDNIEAIQNASNQVSGEPSKAGGVLEGNDFGGISVRAQTGDGAKVGSEADQEGTRSSQGSQQTEQSSGQPGSDESLRSFETPQQRPFPESEGQNAGRSETQGGSMVKEVRSMPNMSKDRQSPRSTGDMSSVQSEKVSESLPSLNERKSWLRIKDDPDISSEIKSGISEEGKRYIPRSLRKVTAKEADAIIDSKGTDESVKMYLDDTSGIHPDVETAIGAKLFTRLQNEGNFEDAVRVFEKLAVRGTELGQAVNAFKLLQGKTMLHVVNKTIKKARRQFKEDNDWRATDAKKQIDEINKKAVEQVLKSPDVQKRLKGGAKKGSIKKAIDFLETLKVDTKGKALDATYGITAAAWNTVITAVQKGLQAGLTISQAINKAVGKVDDPNFKKKEAVDFLQDKLKDYRVTLDPAQAIKAELKEQGQSLDDIIRSHYSEQTATRQNLIDKLIKDGNVAEDEAQAIADEIGKKFDELTSAAKRRALKKLLPREKKQNKRQRRELTDDIVAQTNMGALSEQEYSDAITDKLGVPKLTAEEAKEIEAITDRIQKAKGDLERSKAAQDLYNYIENRKGWKWWEAVESVWFANMLSGPSTLFNTNPFANFTNLFAEAAIDISRNPKHAGFILSRIASGLAHGLVKANDVIRTGYNPYKGEDYKTESKPLLERIEFKGGAVNPLNWLKYVARIMKAGDVIFYQGLKEQALAMEAIRHPEVRKAIAADNFDNAMDQAESEGFKGREQKLRAYEILEASRPELAVKEAENFASRGTFNYKPEGALGGFANSLNNMRRDIPGMKIVVPFVNTIINVANEYLNYNPVIGAWRAYSGSMGLNKDKSTYRKLSRDERIRIGIKAAIGATAMAAVFALDDPDDKDSEFEITANGTGDVRKNYELQRTGWRPYSVRIGDKWYSYKNTPLAMPLASVGFLKDAQRYTKNPTTTEAAQILALGTWKFFQDQSALTGLADFLELINKENLSQYGQSADKLFKYLEGVAKSVVIPNYFTQISRLVQELTDDPMKRADGMLDGVIRDMPVARDHLGNLYDAFGDPVVAKQSEKLIPLNPSRQPEDVAMFEFLKDNKLFVGVPSKTNKKPNGDEMTEEEFQKFAIASGKGIKQRILREYRMYARQKNKEVVDEWFSHVKEQERKAAKLKLFGYF